MSKNVEATDCAMLKQINQARKQQLKKCPFDNICSGNSCELQGISPPRELLDDERQIEALQHWISNHVRRN